MARKSKDDYTESLEREVKQLKALNRQLMRRLKKLDRNFKAIEELTDSERHEDDKEVAKEEAKAATRCPSCLQATTKTMELGIRKYSVCSNGCGYRKLIK